MPPPAVLFAVHNDAGSALHRGRDVARLLNQSWVRCSESANATADVVVHVKFPCAQLRHRARHHVLDVVDNWNHDASRHDWIHTAIVSTREAADACPTRRCVRIPHHANLACREHPRIDFVPRPVVVGVVGTDFWSKFNLVSVALVGYTVRTESPGDPCAFYDAIDVAVVWKKNGNAHSPAERFTNPVYFNIPTVVHSFYAGPREYNGSAAFACGSYACLRPLVASVAAGGRRGEFASLREEVRRDVSPASVARAYGALFASLW